MTNDFKEFVVEGSGICTLESDADSDLDVGRYLGDVLVRTISDLGSELAGESDDLSGDITIGIEEQGNEGAVGFGTGSYILGILP